MVDMYIYINKQTAQPLKQLTSKQGGVSYAPVSTNLTIIVSGEYNPTLKYSQVQWLFAQFMSSK